MLLLKNATLAPAVLLTALALTGAVMSSPASAAPEAMMDTTDHSGGWVGKTAQPFTLPDAAGKTVDLSKVIGTRPVVLIFYRGNWCPFCHSQMNDLARHKADFAGANAAVYAISNETAPDLLKMQTASKTEFVTFLSDPDGKAAALYAGVYPDSKVHQPGSFVIDKSGKIVYAYVNSDYKSRAATASMVKAAQKVSHP